MLRKMKINKYFLGIVLIIIIIMYFMAGVLFLGNTREDNNMKVSTEQQRIEYQTFKSETEGYSLASKYAENLQNNSLDKEAINLQLQEAKKFLQDNIKGISRESDNFAQMFYYCGIIYGLDSIYNCGDYEFVKVGIEVRRKSRAGKSLEHHLAAIFDGNAIQYSAQAVTEGNKKPDFIFPSGEAYHNSSFNIQKLVTLAAKTTCKDRWRQVLNEANRLKDSPKYLCTLQQGISGAQMDEMQAENVVLVVPEPYIVSYPEDRRDRIWTIARFVKYIQEIEG